MASNIVLIGSEYEENLSLRYLAASLTPGGFRVSIVPFDHAGQRESALSRTLALDPLVVGISVPFQLRAHELLSLAQELRARGYRGHIAIGGHFATFEYRPILRDYTAIDSVVCHEGEQTFRELAELVREGEVSASIPGLVETELHRHRRRAATPAPAAR